MPKCRASDLRNGVSRNSFSKVLFAQHRVFIDVLRIGLISDVLDITFQPGSDAGLCLFVQHRVFIEALRIELMSDVFDITFNLAVMLAWYI